MLAEQRLAAGGPQGSPDPELLLMLSVAEDEFRDGVNDETLLCFGEFWIYG